ncbi:unnamed protein product [Caenorhabditis angaria]|uniref:G-protein coupled receptors family 1 profile domain-containing protein n=1 Tax=Caenorhabditis angaria TaxID=860376 RepID=A0A9P1N1D1_9PELO|nr:unnamed protein product [Caenorhabditis angaria]
MEPILEHGEARCSGHQNASLEFPVTSSVYLSTEFGELPSVLTQIFIITAFLLLILVAVIGNSVVLWIIYRHKVMHHGFNFFLFNMAFADLLNALFNVGTSWPYNLYYDWWFGNTFAITTFFGIAPTTVSVCSMMCLSYDRCLAVTRPLRKRPLSRRRSLIAISVIWLISTATALPFAWDAHVEQAYIYDCSTGALQMLHLARSNGGRLMDTMLFVIQYAIPLLVLSTTFAKIALTLRESNEPTADNKCSKQSCHNRAKSKAIKMLALMVLAFMICWLPYHIYHTSMMEGSVNTYLLIYWVAMSSCAFNPIIYCFSNERFRIGFRYVFRWIPNVECKRENYEYSQLFPDKMRSMAISLQKGRMSATVPIQNEQRRHFSSQGYSTPDIVKCSVEAEKPKKYANLLTSD